MFNIFSQIVLLDSILANKLYLSRVPALDNFFLIFTRLGEWVVILIGLLILVLVFYKTRYRFIFWFQALGVFLTGTSIVILKALVNRDRPAGDIPLYQESLSSFPSAHAGLVFIFWSFLTYVIWRTKHELVTKILFTIISAVIILAVGFSRLYLGVHFLSDVFGGYLVALLWLLVLMYCSRRYFKKR